MTTLTNKFIKDICDTADAQNMDIMQVITELVQRDYQRILNNQKTTINNNALAPVPFIKEPI